MCPHANLRGHPIYNNHGNFDQKGRKVSQRSIPSAPVCMHLSRLQLSLILTHLYILGIKRKRKEAGYISIHQHCCFSLLYNMFSSVLLYDGYTHANIGCWLGFFV